jgi:hypothetical protein
MHRYLSKVAFAVFVAAACLRPPNPSAINPTRNAGDVALAAS